MFHDRRAGKRGRHVRQADILDGAPRRPGIAPSDVLDQTLEERMLQWIMILIVALSAIAAASGTYTAFKVYQMTDGKSIATKAKR